MTGFSMVSPQPNSLDTTLAEPGFNTGITNLTNPAAFVWSEAVASTPEDWAGFHVSVSGTDNHAKLLMIAVGAAGSEQILATLPVDFFLREGESTNFVVYVPIAVAAGSRLAWTWVGSTTVTKPAQVMGVRASDFPGATGLIKFDAGPFNIDAPFPDNYHGVIITHPTSNNAKSAWTELSILSGNSATGNAMQGNSIAHVYKYIGVLLFMDYVADTALYNLSFDIGYGPVGAEVVLVEGIHAKHQPSAPRMSPLALPMWIPWNRPAGDRIAIRLQTDNITKLPVGIDFQAVMVGLR